MSLDGKFLCIVGQGQDGLSPIPGSIKTLSKGMGAPKPQ